MLIANLVLAAFAVASWEEPKEIGNYDVAVTIGPVQTDTRAHLKFGTQRLATGFVELKAGETRTVEFTARVPGPYTKRNDGSNMSLHLDLYQDGDAPKLDKVTVTPAPETPTIYLCGDSTVTDQRGGIYASWGQALPMMANKGWAVSNFARSGLALETFKADGRLNRILAHLKPGDWVCIQFGHNDQKRKGQEPENGYTELLNEYCDVCEAKGAKMVIISPCERRRFDKNTGAQQPKTLDGYAQAARKVAEKRGIPFIDLNDATYRMNGVLGAEGTKEVYCFAKKVDFPALKADKADNTHHSLYGAYLNARIVAAGLAQIPGIGDAIKPEFREFDFMNPPPNPDFPLCSKIDATKPEGN